MTHPSLSPTPIDWCDAALMIAYPVGGVPDRLCAWDVGVVSRLRKAWRVWVGGYDDPFIYYAPTANKARMQAWRDVNDCGVAEYIDISARRATEEDQHLPDPHPIASSLTEKERKALLHAYGFKEYKPWKSGYRDHYVTTLNDPPLVGLASRRLMVPHLSNLLHPSHVCFLLTDLGRDVALSLMPEYAA